MQVEGPMKLPVKIIEISRLPYFGGLVAGLLKAEPLDGVFHQDPAFGSVYFQPVSIGVDIGGIVGSGHAAHRPAGKP